MAGGSLTLNIPVKMSFREKRSRNERIWNIVGGAEVIFCGRGGGLLTCFFLLRKVGNYPTSGIPNEYNIKIKKAPVIILGSNS